MKGHPVHKRLGYALAGLAAGWRREHSFRVHVWTFAVAAVALMIARPAPIWWALFGLTAAAVCGLELINGAVEALADLVEPNQHPEIKAIKDMLSGAVLLAGGGAGIALLAFLAADGPRLLNEWGLLAGSWGR